MAEKTFRTVSAAIREIEKDLKKKEKLLLRKAIPKAARMVANYVRRETVPRAFGELAESIHVEDGARGSTIVADAPHAAPVEFGSRPHTPPLEPLIRWVLLRGYQGITPGGNVLRNKSGYGVVKNWRLNAAVSIGSALVGKVGRGAPAKDLRARIGNARSGVAAAAPMDAPPEVVEVARAIQRAIAKRGTKPFRYMAQGAEVAPQYLDRFVKEALRAG